MKVIEKYYMDIFPPNRQGVGEFDNGKITEIKPIDFPGGSGEGKRIGPLFYWAWATANGDGIIGMHPHQAFEIISYVIKGEIGHSDSLGNKTRVGEGGAQIMQTGAGVYHQEEMYGERTEFFQIWFEPNLRETIKTTPTYKQLTHDKFPVHQEGDTSVKKILGDDSPVTLIADSKMEDITISADGEHVKKLNAGKCFSVVVINGSGNIEIEDENYKLEQRYNAVIKANKNLDIRFTSDPTSDFRFLIIEVPVKVDYKLYGEF